MLSNRKKSLLHWLQRTSTADGFFVNELQIQKFLFFYECFSKIDGDLYEFNNLMGYKRGPVFSDVYTVKKQFQPVFMLIIDSSTSEQINEDRAVLSLFLVRVLGKDLSDFTHSLNIWKSKEELINNTKNVPLSESDFSDEDARKFTEIQKAYTPEYINSVNIFEVDGKAFLFPKNSEFKEDYYDAFYVASHDERFQSPVYADIVEGELCLD